jgi:hypothetical protein
MVARQAEAPQNKSLDKSTNDGIIPGCCRGWGL